VLRFVVVIEIRSLLVDSKRLPLGDEAFEGTNEDLANLVVGKRGQCGDGVAEASDGVHSRHLVGCRVVAIENLRLRRLGPRRSR
jgi:hypothetical protein